eukprot:g10569.t1
MGDDLGDEWVAEALDSGDEGVSMTVTEAAEPPTAKSMKTSKNGKGITSTSAASAPTALAGRKRGRAQLSAEGFEESDGDSDGTGDDDGDEDEEEEDEESRLKAAAEEEAKLRRAEKKKQKLKALKAKMKEKKKQRSAEEAAAAAAAHGGQAGGGDRKGAAAAAAAGVTAGEEAEELWARFCKVRGDLVTPLELDFPWITEGSLARVDGFGAHTAMKLVGFIKASLPDWKKRIQNRNSNAPRGSPSVLIVCAGARRCVEVMKHLTAFRCQVVKLFAKHLKIEEQKVMLKKGCFPIGVGTPGRMRALATAGSLRLDSSALVVLDLEKNVKGRNVLDMDGVSGDTMAFLAECVRPHLASSQSGKKHKGGGVSQGKGVTASGQGQLRIALY